MCKTTREAQVNGDPKYLSTAVTRNRVIPEGLVRSGHGLLVVVVVAVTINGCRKAECEDASRNHGAISRLYSNFKLQLLLRAKFKAHEEEWP